MSLPYFPLYPTDFEADTSHLTLAEDGAYNRLLRLMWMTPNCDLPDDDEWLRRRLRCSRMEYGEVAAPVIAEFFKRENGRISNTRLLEEYEKAKASHEKRVSAGQKGGKTKSLKNNDTPPSNAKAKPKQPEPYPEPDNKQPLEQGESPQGIFYKDLGVGFTSGEIENLIKAYPFVDIRKKLSEKSFVEWAIGEEGNNYTRVISNFFKSQNTKLGAQADLDGRVIDINSAVKRMS